MQRLKAILGWTAAERQRYGLDGDAQVEGKIQIPWGSGSERRNRASEEEGETGQYIAIVKAAEPRFEGPFLTFRLTATPQRRASARPRVFRHGI